MARHAQAIELRLLALQEELRAVAAARARPMPGDACAGEPGAPYDGAGCALADAIRAHPLAATGGFMLAGFLTGGVWRRG